MPDIDAFHIGEFLVQADNPNLPPEQFETGLPTLEQGWDVFAGSPGDLQSQQPIDPASRQIDGFLVPTFEADFYHRVWVIPRVIDVGNLLGDVEEVLWVWSAHTDGPRTLDQITETNAEGIVLDGPTLPVEFAPDAVHEFALTVGDIGPAAIDAAYTFSFEHGEQVSARVVGTRVVIFAHRPNWAQPVVERLSWLTDLIRARDGTEQAIVLRSLPRRSLSYEVLARGRQARDLDRALWAWQARVFAVPLWFDVGRLKAAVAPDATELLTATEFRGYEAGRHALLWSDHRTFEAVEVDQVLSDRLVLARGVRNAWPPGTRLYPLMMGRMPLEQAVERPSADTLRASLTFSGEDRPAVEPAVSEVTHDGFDFDHRRPNRAADLTSTYQRFADVLDSQTGRLFVDDPADRPFVARAHSYVLRDRVDTWAFRRWLYARRGRAVPFWASTWHTDLVLLDEVGPAITAVRVQGLEYERWYALDDGRRDIALQLRDGTWLVRRVTEAADDGDADETVLTIDGAFGMTVSPAQVRRFCWAELVRLSGDEVEFAWHSAGVATADVGIRGTRQ